MTLPNADDPRGGIPMNTDDELDPEIQKSIDQYQNLKDPKFVDKLSSLLNTDDNLEAIENIQAKFGFGKIANKKIVSYFRKSSLQRAIDELEQLKIEMRQHTVPEGKNLITRSYLENTIDFKIAKLGKEQ